MNAFELFDIEAKFNIDLAALRKKFIQLQLNHHPDLKGDNVETSAFINESYNTLNHTYERYGYLLKLKGLENESKLDNLWLMEMMELNDDIEASKGDSTLEAKATKALQTHFDEVNSNLQTMSLEWDQKKESEMLNKIAIELQKIKYLQRLQKILDGVEEM